MVDNSYWAGLFDGEGCVYIKVNNSKTNRAHYELFVEIQMCSREPIELAKEQFGGKFRVRAARAGRREAYHWKIGALKAKAFLEAIQPYSIVKRDQIKVALEFQEIVSSRNHTGRIPISEEELAVREQYRLELQHLKTIS